MAKVAAIYLSHLTYPSYAVVNDERIRTGDHCVVEYPVQKGKKKPLRRTAYVGVIEGRASSQLSHVSMPEAVSRANDDEVDKYKADRKKYRDSVVFCKQWSEKLNLNMKVSYIEPNETDNKVTFYFTADKRVDFRELVKKLSAEHKCRIELWQIGHRDEAGALGGYGCCGAQYCCSLGGVPREPVTLSMVRDQDISLPPSQLTGACGRLRCCVLYEHEQYVEMGKDKPPIGSVADTNEGDGIVIDRNLLNGVFVLRMSESGSIVSMTEESIKGFHIPKRGKKKCKKETCMKPEDNGNDMEAQVEDTPPPDETPES